MKTEFIPYEQALTLKELGFNEPCFGWFRSTLIPSNFTEFFLETEFGMNESPSDWVNSNFLDKACSAPLYQQAFRWFREKYNISYSIDWMSRSSEFYNGYYVHFRGINDNKINQENFIVLNDELPSKGYKVYKTYEEAELACLKKLIEIVNK